MAPMEWARAGVQLSRPCSDWLMAWGRDLPGRASAPPPVNGECDSQLVGHEGNVSFCVWSDWGVTGTGTSLSLASRKAGCAAMETTPTLQMGKWAHRAAAVLSLLAPGRPKAELCISGGGGGGGPGPHSEASAKGPRAPGGRGAVFSPTSPSPQKGKRKRRKKKLT